MTQLLPFPLEGERVRVDPAGTSGSPLVRLHDGVPAGLLRLEVAHEPEGDVLIVREFSVEPDLRGYGLGSEAVRLLREAAESGSYAILRAWAPPTHGLAVYFWIRMGLHPCHGPGPDGGLWFERALRSAARTAP